MTPRIILCISCLVLAITGAFFAQAADRPRLNPVIEKMEAGQVAYGVWASDFTLAGGAAARRKNADFVMIDMEHSPLWRFDLDSEEGILGQVRG